MIKLIINLKVNHKFQLLIFLEKFPTHAIREFIEFHINVECHQNEFEY